MEHDTQLRGKTHSCDVTICFYFEPQKWLHKRGMPYSRYKIASTWQEQQMRSEVEGGTIPMLLFLFNLLIPESLKVGLEDGLNCIFKLF